MLPYLKQACVNCHFFLKQARAVQSAPVLEITEAERNLSLKGDYSWHKPHYAIYCHFKVWDEGHDFDINRRHQIVVEINRRAFCFFWQHRPGMMLPAAETLQKREAQAREAAQDRRLTIIGLWIAALALLADVAMRVAERLNSWPFR